MKDMEAWLQVKVRRPESRVQALLDSDYAAPEKTFSVLKHFDPDAATALDRAMQLYVLFLRISNESPIKREAEGKLKEIAAEKEMTYESLLKRLQSGEDGLEDARKIYLPFRALDVGSVVFVMAARHFCWMATDILRGRLTSAVGLLRLQVEAVALAHLFQAEPGQADTWLTAAHPDDGRRFHRQNQSKVRRYVEKLGLTFSSFRISLGASRR